jgi:hypothetical protein
MDEGYIDQNYYEDLSGKISLQGDREETYTYEDYGWTEHVSRKWGQWFESPEKIIKQLNKCGFNICEKDDLEK